VPFALRRYPDIHWSSSQHVDRSHWKQFPRSYCQGDHPVDASIRCSEKQNYHFVFTSNWWSRGSRSVHHCKLKIFRGLERSLIFNRLDSSEHGCCQKLDIFYVENINDCFAPMLNKPYSKPVVFKHFWRATCAVKQQLEGRT